MLKSLCMASRIKLMSWVLFRALSRFEARPRVCFPPAPSATHNLPASTRCSTLNPIPTRLRLFILIVWAWPHLPILPTRHTRSSCSTCPLEQTRLPSEAAYPTYLSRFDQLPLYLGTIARCDTTTPQSRLKSYAEQLPSHLPKRPISVPKMSTPAMWLTLKNIFQL